MTSEAIIGAEVEVLEAFEGEGNVLLAGERWAAQADEPMRAGQGAIVTAIEGLLLKVRSKPGQEKKDGNDIH